DKQTRIIVSSALSHPGGIELKDSDRDSGQVTYIRTPWAVWLHGTRRPEESRGEGVILIEPLREKTHRAAVAQRFLDRGLVGEHGFDASMRPCDQSPIHIVSYMK